MATGKVPPMTYPKEAMRVDGSAAQDERCELNGDLWEIPIERIDCNVSNHRMRQDEAKIAELAKSIEQHGLQQPIRVYHQGQDAPAKVRFTLGFGFRRLAAHRRLKRDTIRALVYPPAQEPEIRAAQAIENLHREDLHPLEEAEACEALLATVDGDVKQAAAMVGRPRSWFENRIALTQLSPRVRQMFLDGLIYLGHAQVIAQLTGHDDQEEIAGFAQARKVHRYEYRAEPVKGDMHPPQSVAETRKHVRDKMRDLATVPWKLDAEFAGKVACSACPQNSANAPGLFDGDQPRKALCLNRACFVEKTRAASSAVTKARNTLVKMNVSATPAKARQAIAERDVDFVKPKAVAESAKRQKQPKRKTPAESRGARQATQEQQAVRDFYDALSDWNQEHGKRAVERITDDAWTMAAFALLMSTSARHETWMFGVRVGNRSKVERDAIDVMRRLLPRAAAVAGADDFLAFAREVVELDEKLGLDDDRIGDEIYEMDDELLPIVVRAVLGDDAPPPPKLEDFQSQPNEKTPAKKKTKRKRKSKRTASSAA